MVMRIPLGKEVDVKRENGEFREHDGSDIYHFLSLQKLASLHYGFQIQVLNRNGQHLQSSPELKRVSICNQIASKYILRTDTAALPTQNR